MLRQMARGRRTGRNRVSRNHIRCGKTDSDDSDEDYRVGEDEEFIESEEEDCSLVEDESDDGFQEFIVDKETNKAKKKVGKPGCAKVSKPRKKKVPDSEGEDDDDSYSRPKPKRKNTASYQIDDDEDDDEEDFSSGHEKNGFDVGRVSKKTKVSDAEKYDFDCSEKPRNRTDVYYQEEEDVDYDESDDDYDEEFTPDEIDFDDDEDYLPASKKSKACKLRMQETQICKVQKRKKNDKELNKAKRKKPNSKKASTINIRSNHDGFRSVKQGNTKIPRPTKVRRRKQRVDSDSEFLSSESSDYDFCRKVTNRSLKSSKMIEDKEILRKCPGRKGKEKVVYMKIAVAKQVCGICLSEEGKRTIRGALNCCSHYFCFACIMEWSKVESRCPLCKQRFTTLCRTFLEDGGRGLRDSIIQIPERDQVYQPSEEDLRNFLDPYEDVLCTECFQGGDDALMLLCDVCDSPAHAYCVGLGREVPEGNWYCNGCRPTALSSINPQLMSCTDPRASHILLDGSSPVPSGWEMFDLNELYVPETPSRQSIGDIRAASPGSGSDAFTLLERRQSFRSRNRRFDNNSISLFGSTALQNTVSFSRLVDNGSSSSRSRGQVLFNQGSTSISRSFGPLRPCTSNRH